MTRLITLACTALALLPAPAADPAPLRSLRIELPVRSPNPIRTSWPAIGCWFWMADEFQPHGYRRFLDLHQAHSSFELLTTSLRHPVEITDPAVHDQLRAAAFYARERGMHLVLDLDVRLARQAFRDRHPGEMQELARLREFPLRPGTSHPFLIPAITLGDHYTFRARPYETLSARLLRTWSYRTHADGIEPGSIVDITARVTGVRSDAEGLKGTLVAGPDDEGRTACIVAAFTLFSPDAYAPSLIPFERGILRQYADVPLAGACKDEWGFPGRFQPDRDDFWYSEAMARAYRKRRPGRDLVEDLRLMFRPHAGRDAERTAAINHWMEMHWQRHAEVENAFYDHIKETFGPQSLAATHPTWYPNPASPEEVFKNSLHWWATRRDLAQTDEATPFAARTALAKKWHSPLWFNMYYQTTVEPYGEDLWRHALAGGRINYHPLYPHDGDLTTSLLRSPLLAADSRVRLLNFIATAPVDCPVAVIFGHPAALNWTHRAFADTGLTLANALWTEGHYADLIPSSEITAGALTLSPEGSVQYGAQRYAAVILVHPDLERPGVAGFFQRAAAARRTALFRVGEWTTDFEGQPFDATTQLPPSMQPTDGATAVRRTMEHLASIGVPLQTPGTPRGAAGFATSVMPRPAGHCRLLDGTVILAAGEKSMLGDPIQTTVQVGSGQVRWDAIGVAACRLDPQGQLAALAAGGLRAFEGGGRRIELETRIDVAFWRTADGGWQGVVQDHAGPIPASLLQITPHWTRLRLPPPLP